MNWKYLNRYDKMLNIINESKNNDNSAIVLLIFDIFKISFPFFV